MNRRSFLAQCGIAGTSLVLGCNAADLAGPKRFYMQGATVKVLRGQSFPLRVDFNPVDGYDVQDCFFANGYTASGGPWSNWAGNVVLLPDGNSARALGHMSDTVLLGVGVFNKHFLIPEATIPLDSVFDGMIYERLGTDSVGDCLLLPPAGSARHYTHTRFLVMPNAVGNCSGTVVSQLGSPAVSVSVTQGTAFLGTGGGGLGGGETYSGYPGMYTSVANNIFYDTVIRGFALKDQSSGAIVTDLVQQGGWGSNVIWNAKMGRSGYGIDWPLSYSPSGIVIENPLFKDDTVSLRNWDLSLGGPGTDASALAGLLQQSFGYTPAGLIAFYRDGMTPTNPLCAGYGAVMFKRPRPPHPPPPDCLDTSAPARATAIGRPPIPC